MFKNLNGPEEDINEVFHRQNMRFASEVNSKQLTHSGSLPGSPLPRLEMVHLVVDLVHHFVVGPHPKQVNLSQVVHSSRDYMPHTLHFSNSKHRRYSI